MSDQSKPALYALTPSAHATIMAALACYADRVGDAFVENGYEDVATNGGTLPLLNEKQISELAESLNNPGLDFSAIVPLFAESSEDSPYVAAARENQREGSFEIDDPAVVSRSDAGAYVMGWMWVDDDTAGLNTYWSIQLGAGTNVPPHEGGTGPDEPVWYFDDEQQFDRAKAYATTRGAAFTEGSTNDLPREEFTSDFDEFKDYLDLDHAEEARSQ